MRKVPTVLGIVLAASLTAAASAGPTGDTFLLSWSGDFFGNTATAEGTITFAAGSLVNPGDELYFIGTDVLNIEVTVSGASIGNGTFTTSAFNFINFNTGGATLDLTTELVGQTTVGGPWGQTGLVGANGDFNLFSNFTDPAAPNGTDFFELTTEGLNGDIMALTSFRPVPAPAALSLLGLAGIGAARRRR
jgi:hypothetical protein